MVVRSINTIIGTGGGTLAACLQHTIGRPDDESLESTVQEIPTGEEIEWWKVRKI
jgi:hypothetical protein